MVAVSTRSRASECTTLIAIIAPSFTRLVAPCSIVKLSGARVGWHYHTPGFLCFFFFSSRRRHTRLVSDWSSDVCSSDLTITADAKNKIYGTADPALTYQITSGALVGSDGLSGSLGRTAGETVGNYAINQGTLTAGTNYTLTFNPANLTIGATPLTVTADAKNKVYGTADPTLTYQFTSGALVGSDGLSGSLSRVAGETVGSYAINQGTLTAGTNYTLTYNSASLAITPRALLAHADNQSRAYGRTNPALTVTYS